MKMNDTAHTPGKNDHRGPLTAQEVNLLQYKLQVAESRIVELESMLNEISASLTDGPDIGPELPVAVKSLQSDMDMFRAEAMREPVIKVSKDGRLSICYGPPVNDDMPRSCDFSGMSAICHKCGIGYPYAPMICPGRANYQIKGTTP